VVRPSLKSDAENAVNHIEGVEHVDDQTEVSPPSPMDDRLRIQLFHPIYDYEPLQKYAMGVQKPIRIIVKNGHVSLEEVGVSDADKNFGRFPRQYRSLEFFRDQQSPGRAAKVSPGDEKATQTGKGLSHRPWQTFSIERLRSRGHRDISVKRGTLTPPYKTESLD
jgi:hypothetical protein